MSLSTWKGSSKNAKLRVCQGACRKAVVDHLDNCQSLCKDPLQSFCGHCKAALGPPAIEPSRKSSQFNWSTICWNLTIRSSWSLILSSGLFVSWFDWVLACPYFAYAQYTSQGWHVKSGRYISPEAIYLGVSSMKLAKFRQPGHPWMYLFHRHYPSPQKCSLHNSTIVLHGLKILDTYSPPGHLLMSKIPILQLPKQALASL